MPQTDDESDNLDELGEAGSDGQEAPVLEKIPQIDKIDLGGFSLDVGYFLGHDYDDISSASIELPPVIEWVNVQLQIMTNDKLDARAELERVEAEAYFRLQAGEFEDRGYAGKKTAHALNLAVCLDQEVIAAKKALNAYDGWTQRLYNVLTSLQSKLELVRSAEATRRKVFDSAEHR